MIERTAWRLVGALGALIAVAGCGGTAKPLGGGDAGHDSRRGAEDASVDGPTADSARDGTDAGSQSRVIGPAGGEVDGPFMTKVVVPAGAVAAPVTLTISDLGPAASAAPALPETVKAVGDVFAMTPHGTVFAAPVTVHVSFDEARVGAPMGRPLALYTAAPGGGWSAIPAAVVLAGALEAQVSHFSFFVVGYEAPEVTLPETTSNKLDMLFMVDNSTSMATLQQKLATNFPQLISTLKSLPGGLPDVHIGVVSSSLGAGQEVGIESCPVGGDGGKLQWMPKGACTTAGPTDHFIAAGAGESTKNYPGTIEDAFSCIALLGDQGCGFEHQLESMAVALGARGAAPPENAGFLRADAALALVMITNEDDCSAPPNTNLFSQTSELLSDPLGPLQSYRCNEFGHLCNGAMPPRLGTLGSVVPLTGCVSAEDGRLNRVSEYAALFKGLKADPSQVFLAAITAPATPYAVTFIPPTLADSGPWPNVQHSCVTAEGEYGDPAVRIAQLVSAFGDHGALYSICDEQYSAVLTEIGASLAQSMGLLCLPKSLENPSSTAPLLTGCTVSESVAVDGGARVETVVPACGGGADPCWSLKANTACSETGAELSLTRTTVAPAGAVLVARCP